MFDVWFELGNALDAEGVGDSLAFACMLGSISRVEESSLNRDKGIVIFTGSSEPISWSTYQSSRLS